VFDFAVLNINCCICFHESWLGKLNVNCFVCAGQHSSYSPSSSSSSGGSGNGSGSSQQWQAQQSAGDYSHHHSSPSPQHSSVLTGSPSASSVTTPSPSPAHTPTPTGSLHSPPPSLAMSGQYPAHHHGRHPPMGSPPQPSQGHNLPSWVHHGAGPGKGMHSLPYVEKFGLFLTSILSR